MLKPVIQVLNISKAYKLNSVNSSDNLLVRSLVKIVGGIFKRMPTSLFYAVKDLSFEVYPGEVIGIIGANGAGKSSLLKLISGITHPTQGDIITTGKVATLLEVGTGFHDELTGRENIMMNGTLMGMSILEIKKHLNEIIEFSGVEDFIDQPIKKYSTGMRMRLAFSIAAYLDADILLIDEILAVGDAHFQKKCLAKMDEIKGLGKTILFVSHNLSALRNLCTRTLFIQQGKIVMNGDTNLVINEYLIGLSTQKTSLAGEELEQMLDYSMVAKSPSFKLNRVEVSAGQSKVTLLSQMPVYVKISITILETIRDLRIIVGLLDQDNQYIVCSQISDQEWFVDNYNILKSGEYNLQCEIPANFLSEHQYQLGLEIINPSVEHLILKRAINFTINFNGYNNIQVNNYSEAYIRPLLNWHIENLN
ncbi:MAG: ABC transporter ATP-binding protein [Bacteroidota bacterium]|nr:ABC transporter ATP-binding protein [Bacteroidota bacterium]